MKTTVQDNKYVSFYYLGTDAINFVYIGTVLKVQVMTRVLDLCREMVGFSTEWLGGQMIVHNSTYPVLIENSWNSKKTFFHIDSMDFKKHFLLKQIHCYTHCCTEASF
jgi:hypothetical protein